MADSNFAPIESALPEVFAIGRDAERSFRRDPRAAMSHLRVFGERLAIALLEDAGLPAYQENQYERLQRLRRDADVSGSPLDHLHELRRLGNSAVHGRGVVGHADAATMLRSAHRLAAWYWRHHTRQPPPPPGPFVMPASESRREDAALQRDLEAARKREAEALQRASAVESQLDALARLAEMPEVATHHNIQRAFEDLPPAAQAEVARFLRKFREVPVDPAWPMVSPDGMADAKVRLVACGAYALVVVAAPRGDLLVIAHVATEPDALAWARTKRFEVNPLLGTLQLFDVEEAEAAAESFEGGLFDAHDDGAVRELGVPAPLLESVRAVGSEEELDALAPHLPPEAADALYLLAAGASVDEVKRELDLERPAAVDPQDFAVAVHHPESQRSFALLDDEADLDTVLQGSLAAWRIYLHPEQRKLVRMKAGGPVRVLGGAGTGKTVALLHRARHLVEGVFGEPTDRLLVTTFTRNLASDLREQLAALVDPVSLERVDVVNFHALVNDLWREHGDGSRVAYDADLSEAWGLALPLDTLELDPSFYRAEWDQVVQAQGVLDEHGYWRCRRPGRGKALGRAQRSKVWRVFEAYRAALDAKGLVESADQMRVLREGYREGRIERTHVALLCDEVQDFGRPELELMRAMIREGDNDLFFVGDTHQRIYGHEVRMGHCGIAIQGRARKLRVNYRTTARVRSWAVGALRGERFDDMDGGEESLDGYRSLRLGAAPEVHLEKTAKAEGRRVVEVVQGWLTEVDPESICVAAPTHAEVDRLARALGAAGVATVKLESEASSTGDGVRVATFARMKGLEFPRVLLAAVHAGSVPLRPRWFYTMDEESREQFDRRQRCQLYVAATRARDLLAVTGHGAPSPFLAQVAPAALEAEDLPETKRCPRCGVEGPVAEVFGYRSVRRTDAKGATVVRRRPQSYCRACRSAATAPIDAERP